MRRNVIQEGIFCEYDTNTGIVAILGIEDEIQFQSQIQNGEITSRVRGDGTIIVTVTDETNNMACVFRRTIDGEINLEFVNAINTRLRGLDHGLRIEIPENVDYDNPRRRAQFAPRAGAGYGIEVGIL